jgi:hypothetical protein
MNGERIVPIQLTPLLLSWREIPLTHWLHVQRESFKFIFGCDGDFSLKYLFLR